MDKEHIINEIRRTAKLNGGVVLGWRRFEEESGIRYYDWYGQFWAKWSDAVREAGFEPNRMSEAFSAAFLIEKLISLTRRLGRVPTQGDLLLASNGDTTFLVKRSSGVLGRNQNAPGRSFHIAKRTPEMMMSPTCGDLSPPLRNRRTSRIQLPRRVASVTSTF